MWKEITFNFLEFFAPLLVVIVFLLLFKQWKGISFLQVLFLYYLCSSINLGFATYLAFENKPNLIWYNRNGFTSLLTLSIFYYQILQNRKYKKLVLCLSSAGLISYVIIFISLDDHQSFFSYGYSIISLLIILYSLIFLREIFSLTDDTPVKTEIIVWIVSSLLTYFLSSYLIHISYKLVTKYFVGHEKKVIYIYTGILWGINNVLYFLSCVFVIVNLFRLRILQKRNNWNSLHNGT